MTAFRDMVDKHIAEGTCYICGKGVKGGEAVHGLFQCHWDCYEREEAKAKHDLNEAERQIKRTSAALNRMKDGRSP